jgi:hypothetical protein
MAMPHPGLFMIPFGCVVCQSQTRKGYSLDIYCDATEIRKKHNAFQQACQHGVGIDLADTIVSIQDDTNATFVQDGCSVIFYEDLALDYPDGQAYWIWRVNGSITVPQQVNSISNEFLPKIVMDSDWYYFLLPTTMRPYGARQQFKKAKRRAR